MINNHNDALPCFRNGIQGCDAAFIANCSGMLLLMFIKKGQSTVTSSVKFTLTRIPAKIFIPLMHEGQELFVWRTSETS